jgi:hypothetical protein
MTTDPDRGEIVRTCSAILIAPRCGQRAAKSAAFLIALAYQSGEMPGSGVRFIANTRSYPGRTDTNA